MINKVINLFFGLFLLGFSSAMAQPEVHVKGNGYDILDAAATWPDSTGQAFGVVQANVDSVSKSYWIYNTGNAPLTLSNFRVTTVYNTQFNITPPTSLVVAPGDSAFFTVEYKPIAAGTHGRTTGGNGVCVAAFDTDDGNEPTYDFRISGAATADPAFDCSSGRMIFSHRGGDGRTDLKEWHYATQPPTLSTVSNALGWGYDGMGMNPNDNYIYAMRYNGGSRHQLWAFSSTGLATFCGYVSGGGITSGMAAHAGGGAIDNNNNLYTLHNADATTSLNKINVKSQQATLITLSSPVHARSAIYNPTDGLLYAMSAGATNDGLVSIDPSNGNVTLIGGDGDLTHAAMFRSTDGTVYMMTETYTMYTVDLTTGAITQVAENPGWGNGTWVDGCACGDVSLEADLAITKTDNRPSYVPGALQNYTISVTNNGPHGAYQATVQDLVPSGITPANVSWYSTTYGTATSTTTSGTGDLNDVVDIGVGDSIVYTVRIIVDNGFTGNLTNIATVTAPSFLTDPNTANNTATDVDTPVGSATEQCNNGFDDDGDGLVDCFDGDCSVNVVCSSHYTNGVHSPCPDTPNVALFSMKQQWTSTAGEDYVTPVLGDMDGDGIPEIVTVNYGNGRIYVLNGQDGSTITNIAYTGVYHNFSGGAAIADIDNDGTAEVFLVTGNAQSGAAGNNCRQWISCFDYDNGSLTQRYRVSYGQININEYSDQKWAVVQFADFDEDGIPELFIGNHVMNSATGAIIASPTTAQRNSWPRGRIPGSTFSDYMSAAADVLPASACANCNGLELICGNTIYAVDLSDPSNTQNGITIATQMAPIGTYTDGLTSLADWDGDGQLDVIVSTAGGGSSNFYIWNPRMDTVIINTTILPNSTGGGSGRASVADFDGDGVNELAIVTRNRLHLYEHDGSLKWSLTSIDGSFKTSATAFDFEGDGNMEVIYRDEQNLRILDGATGAVKDILGCISGTRVEMPVIADVDADGEAEICVSCGSNTRVYTSDQTPWMPTRKVWNSVHYVPTFINDDLTIPPHRQPKATTPRMDIYAAQVPITDPSGNLIYPALPDFVITIDSSTVGSCNDDAPSLKYDYPLSFYNGDPNSGGTLLGTRWVTLANTTFTRDSCYYFTFNAPNQPTDLYIIPNDKGTGTFGYPTTHIQECDSSNNAGNRNVGCSIDAGITKDDGQLSYIPGGPVTYTIVAKNEGPNFKGGVVSDPLPTGVNAGDVTWTATTYGGATTKAIGTMNGALQDTVDITGGDSVVYTVTIATPASLVGDLVNVVTITVTGDTITTNNTATDTDTVDCTFAIRGGVNSRRAGWTELGTVRSGLTYNFGTSGGFKTFTASNGPEKGKKVSTVIFNNGTKQHVSLTKNKYNPSNGWISTVGIYDNTPHGWTGLSGVAPENAPILGFMAFVDQNGNGTFDSGVEEYIRDINSLSITPSTTGQLYMAFYDDGPYNDNSGSLTVNASVTAATVGLGNDTTFCSGNSVTLDAENPGSSYLWSTGATSKTIVANATGQYNVAVSTGGGCVVRDTMNITVDTVLVSLGNDTSFCSSDSITLDAENPGDTYLWSTGETSQTIVAKAVGQYSVMVTNGDGCIGRDTMNITSLIDLPTVTLGNDTAICTGDSLALDAENAGATYEWNDASTNQTLNAKSVGQYFVRVTNGDGCIGRDTMNITSLRNLPTVSLGNDTAICTGDSLVLDAENAGATYQWNDASTNQTLNVKSVGQYFVAVNVGGCIGRDTMSITGLNSLPIVDLGNDATICDSDSLILDAENIGATYKWNDASTAQTLTVNAIGQYFVEVSNSNGCLASDTMNITAITSNPTVNLGNDSSICSGASLTLNAENNGAEYVWNEGSTQQTLTINAVGEYHVAVSDGNGCVGRDTMNLTALNALPTVSLGNDTAICADATINLNAGNTGATFLWNDASTGQTLNINRVGEYHVAVTDGNGCVGRDTMELTGFFDLPVVDLGPDPTTICAGSSLTLDAQNTGASYLWHDGSIGQTFTANAIGQYHVRVTNSNNCITRDTMNITGISNDLDVQLGNDTAICAGTTLTLNAGNTGGQYTWSDGSNSQTLDVTAIGEYHVEVQDPSGCTGSDTIEVTALNPNPIVALGDDYSICESNTTTLDAGNAGSDFLWNDNSTQQTLDVNQAGQYYVVVTDLNGCFDTDTITIGSNGLPTVTVDDHTICEGDRGQVFTVTCEPEAVAYIWSDNGSGTEATTTGNIAGLYTVKVTDINGCQNTASGSMIINALPNITVAEQEICEGDPAATFTVVSDTTIVNYFWSENGSGTEPTSSGTAPGNYTVDVVDANSCRGNATGVLTVHELPVVTLNDANICPGTTSEINPLIVGGDAPYDFTWSTDEKTPSVNKGAGSYGVDVSDAHGCSSSASITITEAPQLTVIIPGPVDLCSEEDTLLISNYRLADGYGFSWSFNNVGTGDVSESIRISEPGTYALVVTQGSCQGETQVEVISRSLPEVNLGNDTTICTGTSLTLNAGNSHINYQWNNGSSAQTIDVNTPGEYHVEVSNNFQCTARDTMNITGLHPLPAVVVNDADICPNGAPITFTATSADAIEYQWSDNGTGTNPTTTGTLEGKYTVTVTDARGCMASASGTLSLRNAPTVTLSDQSMCIEASSVTFTAESPTATSFLWSDLGVGSQATTTGNKEGNYTVTVSDGTCSASVTATLTVYQSPEIDLGDDFSICEGETATISAAPYTNVLWQDGSSTMEFTVDTSLQIKVTVIDDFNCTATDSVSATWTPSPTFKDIRSDTTICEKGGDEILLEVKENNVEVEWQDGSTSNEFLALKAGTYTATITDDQGCAASKNVVLRDSCSSAKITLPNVVSRNSPFKPIEDPSTIPVHWIDFTVYNRWGMTVFFSEGMLPYWSGINMHRAKPCPTGAYFWILKYEDLQGNKYEMNGFMELITSD